LGCGDGSQCFWANSTETWSFFWLPKNWKVMVIMCCNLRAQEY
jgi:hypothetical protein